MEYVFCIIVPHKHTFFAVRFQFLSLLVWYTNAYTLQPQIKMCQGKVVCLAELHMESFQI